MSNIYTSYIRLYPKDRKPMPKATQDYLVNSIVRSYDEFASYWVRIYINWNTVENALDIQFGSGKTHHTERYIMYETELVEKFFVWERVNDEGTEFDFISWNVADTINENLVDSLQTTCIYGFDTLRVNSFELTQLIPYANWITNNNYYYTPVAGTYYASNNRGFIDLEKNTDFNGPYLKYNPDYTPLSFCKNANSQIILPQNLEPIITRLNTKEFKGTFELMWRNKVVQKAVWEYPSYTKNYKTGVFYSNDSWDNCLNESYLKFREDYHAGRTITFPTQIV